MQLDTVDEIETRAISAFYKRFGHQPARGLTSVSDCGQYVELHNRDGLMAKYKIVDQPDGGFKLSYVQPEN